MELQGLETLTIQTSQFQYTSLSAGTCVSIDFSSTFSVLVTAASATTTSTQYYTNSGAGIWADVIQVRYKSSDIITATATSTNSASTSNPTGASSTATSQSAQHTTKTKSGLSTGAKVAIGVVVPVVVLCALLFIGFFLYRRRRRLEQQKPSPVQPSELPASKAIVEMAAAPTPKESGRNLVAELEAREQYR
jgi:hypothetical protein